MQLKSFPFMAPPLLTPKRVTTQNLQPPTHHSGEYLLASDERMGRLIFRKTG